MAAPKKRILICDDDPAVARVLAVNLEFEGYDILTAHGGEEAIDLAAAEHPDLIFLDIMMPRLDGYETCRRLKAGRETKEIPVVFISARAQSADIEAGHAAGVDAYLTKPFDPEELLEVIDRLIEPGPSS